MSYWDTSTLSKLYLPKVDSRVFAQKVADVTPELDRNHAVGQASRLSPTWEALARFSPVRRCPPNGQRISEDGDRRDACPTGFGTSTGPPYVGYEHGANRRMAAHCSAAASAAGAAAALVGDRRLRPRYDDIHCQPPPAGPSEMRHGLGRCIAKWAAGYRIARAGHPRRRWPPAQAGEGRTPRARGNSLAFKVPRMDLPRISTAA